MNRHLERLVRRFVPGPAHYYRHVRAARRLGDRASDRSALFARFVSAPAELSCLQIGVRGSKFGPNWISVDLYDESPEIDFNYDIHDLPFPAEKFDRVVCNGVLEHVPRPEVAITELTRVLRPGGEIWVEVPFNQAYHPDPGDFWRVTPDGLRIWLRNFDEVSSGLFTIDSCPIHTGVYFHGRLGVAREPGSGD